MARHPAEFDAGDVLIVTRMARPGISRISLTGSASPHLPLAARCLGRHRQAPRATDAAGAGWRAEFKRHLIVAPPVKAASVPRPMARSPAARRTASAPRSRELFL